MSLKNDNTVRIQRNRICLHEGDSVYLRRHAGAELRVYGTGEAGAPQALLWITEEHEFDDVFLRPGECHVLRGNGSVIATAWAALLLRVVPASEVARERSDGERGLRQEPARRRSHAAMPRWPATPARGCVRP